MVVYADVIFAVNFVSAYAILYILGRVVNKEKPLKRRLGAASAWAGLSAAALFCIEIPAWTSYMIRFLSVIMMVAIAYFTPKRRLFEQIIWFALMTGIIVFSMIAITSLLSVMTEVVIKNGVIYFDLPPLIFSAAFAASYLLMVFFLKVFKNRSDKRYYIMSVTHNDRTITVTALFDSGNLLKEPITGKCVNILEWEEAKRLFGVDFAFEDIENHMEEMKLWIVPYNSLGNTRGTLFAFAAEKISFPEQHKEINGAFVALYGSRLSKNKEYHALINAGQL